MGYADALKFISNNIVIKKYDPVSLSNPINETKYLEKPPKVILTGYNKKLNVQTYDKKEDFC